VASAVGGAAVGATAAAGSGGAAGTGCGVSIGCGVVEGGSVLGAVPPAGGSPAGGVGAAAGGGVWARLTLASVRAIKNDSLWNFICRRLLIAIRSAKPEALASECPSSINSGSGHDLHSSPATRLERAPTHINRSRRGPNLDPLLKSILSLLGVDASRTPNHDARIDHFSVYFVKIFLAVWLAHTLARPLANERADQKREAIGAHIGLSDHAESTRWTRGWRCSVSLRATARAEQ